MARKPKPKPQPEAPKNVEELAPFDTDADDEDVSAVDVEEPVVDTKSRDWRDVEKLKELRELRKRVDDDLDL